LSFFASHHKWYLSSTRWILTRYSPCPYIPNRYRTVLIGWIEPLKFFLRFSQDPLSPAANILNELVRLNFRFSYSGFNLLFDLLSVPYFAGYSSVHLRMSVATGLYSTAWVSHPSLITSSGIEPPPANGSRTLGSFPPFVFSISSLALPMISSFKEFSHFESSIMNFFFSSSSLSSSGVSTSAA